MVDTVDVLFHIDHTAPNRGAVGTAAHLSLAHCLAWWQARSLPTPPPTLQRPRLVLSTRNLPRHRHPEWCITRMAILLRHHLRRGIRDIDTQAYLSGR